MSFLNNLLGRATSTAKPNPLQYVTPDKQLPVGSQHKSTLFNGAMRFNNSPYNAFGANSPHATAMPTVNPAQNITTAPFSLMKSPQGNYYYENENSGKQINPNIASGFRGDQQLPTIPFSPMRTLPIAGSQQLNPQYKQAAPVRFF